ncbi:MAG: flagellar hook-basal body complex protein [Lachnospiraceae bacterium]|nr:flagellar hook-basal body complex protein [Lachnospiraceae bacterium]
MMRAMYSGVAGLRTHQTRMDVIGNNIANVNTVAFKSQSMTFAELMYQTTQNASGPNATTGTGGINARQIGLGVKTAAINTNIATEGASQTTNNPFDIRITGDAFFIVYDGSETFFTRDGSFYVDAVGNLVMTSNGYNVMGWLPDPDNPNNIVETDVQKLVIMSPENMTYEPEATSLAHISGIIDKNDTNVTSDDGKQINLQLYDSLGYSYTAKFALKSSEKEGVYGLELKELVDEDNNVVPLVDANGNAVDVGFSSNVPLDRPGSVSLGTGYNWDTNGTQLFSPDDPNTPVFNVGEAEHINLATTDADALKAQQALADAYGVDSVQDLTELVIQYDVDQDGKPEGEMTVWELITNTPNQDYTHTNVPAGGTATQVTNEPPKTTMQKVALAIAKAADPTVQQAPTLDTILANIDYDREIIQGHTLNYDPANGLFVGVDGNSDTFNLDLSSIIVNTPMGTSNFENIVVDVTATNMWNNSGASTVAATNGDAEGLGTGRRVGEMSGISIQTDGKIYATYDNGQTKLLGQIAVAEFANPSGLEKEGDNLYSDTLNSGEFDGVGVNITANGGYMNTGILEMSNVDLAAEFTEMITTQRGFQANSRIITVSDTLLEELVNLKR